MFGLSGIGLRLAIIGIVITVITAAVGGFFLYQKSVVAGLNDTINAQASEITILKENAIKLEASNTSLELQIDKRAKETKAAYEEITKLREKDIESVSRVNEVERILRDRNRNERLSLLRKSRKASLLLKLMDRDISCQVVNFYNIDGKCIRGKWVPKGERLVPKIEGVTDEN